MTLQEYFKAVTHGKWITGGLNIQYRLENRVLYFQASNEESDWALNFDFPAVPYKHMKEKFLVHRGFLKAWKSVRDEIALLDFDTIVGYSMGGAMATLAHEDFRYRKGYQLKTIVFGCPKVLFLPSRHARSRFTEIERFANREDIVSKLPPFFTHVGKFGRMNEVKLKRPEGFPLLAWLSGHTPQMYRMRLEDI